MMPLNKRASQIAIGWLIMICIIWYAKGIWANGLFPSTSDMTFNLIFIVFGLPAFGIIIWQGIGLLRHRIKPFILAHQIESPYKSKIAITKNFVAIPIGDEFDIGIRVITQHPAKISELHIRLVNERKWVGASKPEQSIACITSLWGEGLIANEIIGIKRGGSDGLEGRYRVELQCAKEKPAHIHIKVIATVEWSGYIALQLCIDNQFKRRYLKTFTEG